MPKAFRSQKKNPQHREPMKQAQQQKKKSLADICKERLEFLQNAKQQKEDAKKREIHRQQEDEVMAMTYGPNWRTKHLPGDPLPSPQLEVITNEEDDDKYEEYEDNYPDAEDSRVRLKAS